MQRLAFLTCVSCLISSTIVGADGRETDPRGVPDLLVSAPGEVQPGATALLQVQLSEAFSMTSTSVVAGAEVVVFETENGAELGRAKTDPRGAAQLSFRVPEGDGDLQLKITGRTPSGLAEQNVSIKRLTRGQILLVTDKPYYQAGQSVHLRALALSAYENRPLAGPVTFEIEDARGNKLVKKKVVLSRFGVASLEVPLAEELNYGSWNARVLLDDPKAPSAKSTRTFDVRDRYVLPRFKVTATANTRTAEPNQLITVDVDAQYFFGKPVQGTVALESVLDGWRDVFQATLGPDGRHRFELRAPPPASKKAELSLTAAVTDSSEHRESTSTRVVVAREPFEVTLVPEGRWLRAGFVNRLYATVTSPDGASLDQLVKQGRIARWREHADKLVVSINEMRPASKEAFEYTLVPRMPLKAVAPESVVYEYYTPAVRALAQPVPLEIL